MYIVLNKAPYDHAWFYAWHCLKNIGPSRMDGEPLIQVPMWCICSRADLVKLQVYVCDRVVQKVGGYIVRVVV